MSLYFCETYSTLPHRECNIAQGTKTLDEFYQWIEEILARVEAENSL